MARFFLLAGRPIRDSLTMSGILEPVRPIELDEIREARKRIADTIVRTPVVRLELGPHFPDIRLKLENLQPINAYKLRGAANAVAMLSEPERHRGVWTISAGNAGQGVAYAARKAGVPCSVVVIETAPGALSFARQSPQAFTGWKQSFVDGAGGKNIFPRMWERMRPVADGSIVVSLEETRQAMRLLAEKSRVITEGAGALSVAAALSGKAGKGPIVAVVSGGNIDLDKFYELISQN